MIKYYYTKPIDFYSHAFNYVEDQLVYVKRGQAKRFTFAAFYDDESKTIKFGLATCSPKDNFEKKVGREIAAKNAKENPFYVIEGFNGRRNNYADEVMAVFISTELKLLKREYPFLFNSNNYY